MAWVVLRSGCFFLIWVLVRPNMGLSLPLFLPSVKTSVAIFFSPETLSENRYSKLLIQPGEEGDT